MDQTPFEALEKNNAFNAVGMRKLADIIATSKKERAQIDAEATKALEAIETVGAVAVAEQAKDIAVIEARREPEVSGTRIRLAAEAERAAVEDDAAALRAIAQPDAQILRDLPPPPAAGLRQPHRFTPKLQRRSVPVSYEHLLVPQLVLSTNIGQVQPLKGRALVLQ